MNVCERVSKCWVPGLLEQQPPLLKHLQVGLPVWGSTGGGSQTLHGLRSPQSAPSRVGEDSLGAPLNLKQQGRKSPIFRESPSLPVTLGLVVVKGKRDEEDGTVCRAQGDPQDGKCWCPDSSFQVLSGGEVPESGCQDGTQKKIPPGQRHLVGHERNWRQRHLSQWV